MGSRDAHQNRHSAERHETGDVVMDLTSLRKRWNDAALPQIPTLRGESHSHGWSLLGMLALGLVAGAALGGYAASQRSNLRRLAMQAYGMGDEQADMELVDPVKPVAAATSTLSNHRRKTASGV
jgi:hypothetical protein